MWELLWPSVCAGCDVEHRGRLCPQCATAELVPFTASVPGVREAWTLGDYRSPLGRALQVAKYRPDRGLMTHVAAAFADRVAPRVADLDLVAIVPAPSPWTTRLRRGFASAAVLAAAVSRRTGLPVRHALRSRPGPRQASQSGAARRANLGGRVRSRLAVPGRVLLVDDVLTTGATVDACARELLGDATEGVWLAVVCVAGEDGLAPPAPATSSDGDPPPGSP